MINEKRSDEFAEHKELEDGVDRHLAVAVPKSLQGLSESEMTSIDSKVTRKVDILLMPALVVLYVLNFLDRNNISTAKIGGLTKDLGMSDQQFSTVVAVLFAGYVSLQIPSNMLASRIPKPAVYICLMTAAWGLVSACTGAVQGYAGLAVCRTVLGFTEAAFFPGALYLLSTFYTRKQMALRTGILYSGSQLGNAFGGLFALAILELDGAHGIEGWRWLFIVEGAITVGIAIIFSTFIPNKPENMRWLTSQERDHLLHRLALDRGMKDNSAELSVWHATKQALTDPKAWLVCLALTLAWVASAVTNFFPLVVQTLGFNRTTTLAITAPPYLFGIICITLNGWHSDKTRERAFHVIGPFVVCIIANIIAVSTLNVGARYFAMMLMPASFYSAGMVLLSWVGTTVVGSNSKRAVALALINAISNTSNIWTSYIYIGKPRYAIAFSVNVAASFCVILVVLVLRRYLQHLNKRLDRGEDLGMQGPSKLQVESGFRFAL